MDLNSFRSLLTTQGQQALQAAEALEPREVDFLRRHGELSKHYPIDLARSALETAILRRSAQTKFPFASRMYFTREALEQASAYQVSAYRAERFRNFSFLVDLGCSIGGDTLTLAGLAPTLGIDRDGLRLNMAQANLQALLPGNRVNFLQADLSLSLPFGRSPSTGLFFDPARRAAGKRLHSVFDYLPPLSVVMEWLPRFPATGIKISPGVDLNEVSNYEAEIEFISLQGELKEAVLWFGPLKSADRRATLLPGGHTMSGAVEAGLPVCEPRAYLYEPDPAVLRASLVGNLGILLDAAQLDPDIAYLTAGELKQTPFARSWAVEDWFPFGLKRLRAYLRQRGIGKVVVKKRGSPLEPEALIHQLRLKGDQERVVFLTQLRGRPIVVVCRGI